MEGVLDSSHVDGGERHVYVIVCDVCNADLADSAACLRVFGVWRPAKWDGAYVEVVHLRALACAHSAAHSMKPLAVDLTVGSSLQVSESANTPVAVSICF